MHDDTDSGGRVDGRTARRDRNRHAVLDAVLDLFSEDNLSPGVHEVAERSGVSLRSVYRYFEDLDMLVVAAIERKMAALRPVFQIDGLGAGPVEARIERFVERRVALFESAAVVHRAALLRAGTDAELRETLTRSRGVLGRQVREMFAPELDAMEGPRAFHAGLAIDVLTQLESLQRLRTDLGLTVAETEEHLRVCLAVVLDVGC